MTLVLYLLFHIFSNLSIDNLDTLSTDTTVFEIEAPSYT